MTFEADGLRYMTLAEAQAIECNGCGDCCDSRRVGFMPDGLRFRFEWGTSEDDGAGLVFPLRVMHPFGSEEAPHPGHGVRIAGYGCRALVPQPDGRALCSAHDAERPALCGDFPVFGRFSDWIAEHVARDGEHAVLSPDSVLTRCAWHGVVVVADDRWVAYLQSIEQQCDRCRRKRATQRLYNLVNAPIGSYCTSCSKAALAEQQAREARSVKA